jgi:hypothetical protein
MVFYTVGIIFSRKRNLGKLVLKIGTHIFEIVKEVKFLGISKLRHFTIFDTG